MQKAKKAKSSNPLHVWWRCNVRKPRLEELSELARRCDRTRCDLMDLILVAAISEMGQLGDDPERLFSYVRELQIARVDHDHKYHLQEVEAA